MNFKQLVILLPCHSLEDFPVHHEGALAEGLLAGWTALWHPALVACAGAAPTWRRAEEPPDEPADVLTVVPQASFDWIPCGWIDEARQGGAVVLDGLTRREEILAAALAQLDETPAVDPDLAADFLALGFGFLQVELLTRQMRYSSYIDETYLGEKLVAAARAAVAGDAAAARENLSACFDLLGQARDHFYPVDSYLVDVMLVDATTLGPALRQELGDEAPTNLLLSGELLEQLATQQPETLATLRAAVEAGRVGIVGGEYHEGDLPLLPREEVLAGLQRGRGTYLEHLGRAPAVYGRRHFGLSPLLPQLLSKLGFRGVLHATFDGGRFPVAAQAKARWQGDDGSAIDALARLPLDAARPETLLALSHRLGETMDSDHVATLLFARWPGAASCWYEDLRRVTRYGPMLGKFVTLDTYFEETYTPDTLAHFAADDYRSAYLTQAVEKGQADPLSRYARAQTQQVEQTAAQSLAAMAALVSGSAAAQAPSSPAEAAETLARQIAPATAEPEGYLLLNPTASRRRVRVELPALSALPTMDDQVRVVGRRGETVQAVVDLPGLGFVWVGPGGSSHAANTELPLAEGNLLRNEHFEARIDPTTGALRAIHSYARRGNLLSQQLAYRAPSPVTWRPHDEGHEADSVMAADTVEVTAATAAMGEIVSRGRLLDREGGELAGFEQRFQLWRGSRVLLLDITLQPLVEPGAHPWTSYYASRFAWSSSIAELWRSTADGSHPTDTRRIEAPQFLEIRELDHRLALLSGGLPFHKRSGDRIVETLLRVRGETRPRFRLGIGVDVAHPMQAALDLMLPDQDLAIRAAEPQAGRVGWLFHLSAPNVIATAWEPIVREGRSVGFRCRLLETEGRAGRVALSAFGDVQLARQIDYHGEPLHELPMEKGKIMIDLARYEWVQVEGYWERQS